MAHGNALQPGCGCGCAGGTTPPPPPNICVSVYGCNLTTLIPATITITTPDFVIYTKTYTADTPGTYPYCVPASSSGTYHILVSSPGYFTRSTDYVVTLGGGTTSFSAKVYLTETNLGVCAQGCAGSPLSGATITLGGAASGSCTTDSSGCCSIPVSNQLEAGDAWTLTFSKSRFTTLTVGASSPAGTGVLGGTIAAVGPLCGRPAEQLIPAPGYTCCNSNCPPHCTSVTLNTPFGSFTATPLGTDITHDFVKSVTAFPYFGTGPTYGSQCATAPHTLASVNVTFSVRMSVCDGTLTVSYAACGFTSDCSSYALQDLPAGGSYVFNMGGSSCTAVGTASCPPGTISSASLIGTRYCDGTYTITESCAGADDPGDPGGGTMGFMSAQPSSEVEPPGLLAKAASFARAATAQAFAGNPKASPETQAARRATCFACPLLDQESDRCRSCGCEFMDLKRSWATSSCPEGYWSAVDESGQS